MFGWWRRWQDRRRLASHDASLLIAHNGTRASYIAKCRLDQMVDGAVFDSNRPACHWRRVYKITRELLPYDGDDGEMVAATPPHPQSRALAVSEPISDVAIININAVRDGKPKFAAIERAQSGAT